MSPKSKNKASMLPVAMLLLWCIFANTTDALSQSRVWPTLAVRIPDYGEIHEFFKCRDGGFFMHMQRDTFVPGTFDSILGFAPDDYAGMNEILLKYDSLGRLSWRKTFFRDSFHCDLVFELNDGRLILFGHQLDDRAYQAFFNQDTTYEYRSMVMYLRPDGSIDNLVRDFHGLPDKRNLQIEYRRIPETERVIANFTQRLDSVQRQVPTDSAMYCTWKLDANLNILDSTSTFYYPRTLPANYWECFRNWRRRFTMNDTLSSTTEGIWIRIGNISRDDILKSVWRGGNDFELTRIIGDALRKDVRLRISNNHFLESYDIAGTRSSGLVSPGGHLTKRNLQFDSIFFRPATDFSPLRSNPNIRRTCYLSPTSDGGCLMTGCCQYFGPYTSAYFAKIDSLGRLQHAQDYGWTTTPFQTIVQCVEDEPGRYVCIGTTASYFSGSREGRYTIFKVDTLGNLVTAIQEVPQVSTPNSTMQESVAMVAMPNPVQGISQLSLIGKEQLFWGEVSLYDVQGRQLGTLMAMGDRSIELDLSPYPAGVYIVRYLRAGIGKPVTMKVIKQ